jgi:hypothetical protein
VLLRRGDRVEAIDHNGGFHLLRVSRFSALAPVFAAAFCVVALLSVPFGRRTALRNRWLRRLPSLALLCLMVSVALMFQLDITRVGEITPVAAGIFLGTSLLPLFAISGLALSVFHWRRETAVVAKTRCLLASLAAVLISIYFAAFHWLALQMWHW